MFVPSMQLIHVVERKDGNGKMGNDAVTHYNLHFCEFCMLVAKEFVRLVLVRMKLY